MNTAQQKFQELYNVQLNFSNNFYRNSNELQYPIEMQTMWDAKAETMDEANMLLVASCRAIGLFIDEELSNRQIEHKMADEDKKWDDCTEDEYELIEEEL